MKLFSFVVMPNHIHLIAKFNVENPVSSVLRDFKKFTARQIHRQIQAEKDTQMLMFVREQGIPHQQEYKVWESGYDARDVFSMEFLQQKMDYIHSNPCQPQWNLVDVPEAYLWSTERFYLAEEPCVIPIDDIREYLQG